MFVNEMYLKVLERLNQFNSIDIEPFHRVTDLYTQISVSTMASLKEPFVGIFFLRVYYTLENKGAKSGPFHEELFKGCFFKALR